MPVNISHPSLPSSQPTETQTMFNIDNTLDVLRRARLALTRLNDDNRLLQHQLLQEQTRHIELQQRVASLLSSSARSTQNAN